MKLKKHGFKFGIRRTAAILTAAVMILASSGDALAYRWDKTPDAPEFESVVYCAKGDAADGMTGSGVLAEGKDGGGYSLGGVPHTVQMFKNFSEEEQKQEFFKNNVALVSLDVCPKQRDHALIFSITAQNGGNAVLMFTGQGKLVFMSRSGWPGADYDNTDSISYEADKWYNIKILIDGNLKRLTYYLNDEYWGTYSPHTSDMFNSKLYGDLKVTSLFFNYQADYSYKDGKQQMSDGSGEFLIDNLTWGFPKRVGSTVEVTTDKLGNILTEGDTPLNLNIANNTDSTGNYTVQYEIRDSENYLYTEENREVSLKSDESRTIVINPKLKRCGFYYINAELIENGTVVDSILTRFSVIAKTEPNPDVGFSVHPMTHGIGSIGETIDAVSVLGGAIMREDFSWAWLTANDGVTPANASLREKMKRFVNAADENNLELLMILGPGPSYMGGANWPINAEQLKSTNALALWKNYCRDLAALIGGGSERTYEVYNEWSLLEKDTGATPETYAEVLKAATAGLRESNPDCKIIGFCTGFTDYEWLDRAIAALGDNPGQYFDAVSIHPYMQWGNYYPEQSVLGGATKVKEVMEKYGVGDKELYATEYGYTTGYGAIYDVDEDLKADYTVRELVMTKNVLAKHYLYTICQKRDATKEYEAGFGFLRGATNEEIPYECLPAAMATAAFNKLCGGAQQLSEKVYDNQNEDIADDMYTYKLKLKDGRECWAIWNVGTEKMMSLDFGTNSAAVYDIYGNEKTLNAADGYITMRVGTSPIFITADKLTDEIRIADTPIFDCDGSVTTMVNSSGVINTANNSGIAAEVTAETSENIKVTNGGDNSGKIEFETKNNRRKVEKYAFDNRDGSYDGMRVVIKSGSNVYLDENIKVKYEDTIETKLSITPYKSGMWQAVVSVRNNNPDKATDGSFAIKNGNKEMLVKEIGGLEPNEKKVFRYIIPEDETGDSISLTTEINTNDGQTMTKTADSELAAICKADKSPIIDGKMDVGEWKVFTSPIYINKLSQSKLSGWGGVSDLSAEIYPMYDSEYFYLGARVTDNVHCGTDANGRVWAVDSIQFSVSNGRTTESKITEIAMALMDDGAKFQRYLSPMSDKEGFEMNKFENTEFGASTDGSVTTYEFKIPWNELFANGYVPKDYLNFSVLVNDNDGSGRRGWLEYGGGIGYEKSAVYFKKIPLMK